MNFPVDPRFGAGSFPFGGQGQGSFSEINDPLTKPQHLWPMRMFLILLILSSCASPDPKFFGSTRHEVTKGGIKFVVFHSGNMVEVVRLGYLTRAERAPVPRLMEEAAAAATGCRVIPNSMKTKIPGDTGEARFDLDC